ncbi:MAG: hypothetical protein Tsb005_20860 [Gammaproteobacteria bacterium]
MKKNKLSESQIIAMPSEGEAGIPVADLCREYHVANSTYYKLKNKYGGMSVSALKRLKSLEDEKKRLKVMCTDISLEYKWVTRLVKAAKLRYPNASIVDIDYSQSRQFNKQLVR